MIRFKIPGEPRGKQRPRVTRSGHAYTPKETVEYERLVKLCFISAANRMGGPDGGRFRRTDRPVSIKISAYYGIPKSAAKARRAEMISNEILPLKKPDIDNVEKIIMDALNGMAYEDDKQVVQVAGEKKWSESPCVIVELDTVTKE